MDWYLRIRLVKIFTFRFLFSSFSCFNFFLMHIVLEKKIVWEITEWNVYRNKEILPISEVKPCSAGLVLGWVTGRELHGTGGVCQTFISASSQIKLVRRKAIYGTIQVPINEIFCSTFIPVRVCSLITQVVLRSLQFRSHCAGTPLSMPHFTYRNLRISLSFSAD